jgi:phage gp45-like
MHRATPIHSSFRAYTAGGARSIVDKVNDDELMQQMDGGFMKGESREKFEAPQNYGFTSVVLPAKKGKDGQISECAEAFINFMGGNRSFPVATVMDDRRHRPMGLKPGENSQYDDIGQMTLMRRNGLYMLSLDSEDESQQQGQGGGGASPGLQAEGGQSGQGKKVERMVSMRHVEKKKQERNLKGATNDGGGGSEQQQQQKSQKDYKHEGETVNTEVRCTAKRIEFRAGDDVVGYYEKDSKTWYLKGKIVTIEAIDGGRVETIKKTYLGLDSKGEQAPPVETPVDKPAKQTFAKV